MSYIRYRMSMSPRQRLDRSAWASAALDALADGGVTAVAVEPIATRLGATKGSFYAHYATRDELIAEAIALWERDATESLIAHLDSLPDARERLDALFEHVFTSPTHQRAELALLADADHPVVAAALAKVTRRRLDYLVAQLRAIGFGRAQARHRGVLAYTAFIGLLQAERAAGGSLVGGKAGRAAYLTFLAELLRPATGEGKPVTSQAVRPPPRQGRAR